MNRNINYKKLSLAIAAGIAAGNLMTFILDLGVDMVVEALL